MKAAYCALIVLTLVEYAAGEATFEDDSGDVRLITPFHVWEAIGQPGDIRVTVEPEL